MTDEIEREARAMWEDAEIRCLSSPWALPTKFEGEVREHFLAKARAALTNTLRKGGGL